jgi:hypothetical protein
MQFSILIFDFRFSIFDFRFLFNFLITTNFDRIVQFHHAFSIMHHCMHPCPAALPGSLARQPCPAALPGSLARQPCPAALPASLARQPCPPALPASLAEKFAEKFASCLTAVIKDIAILSLVYELISTCERG